MRRGNRRSSLAAIACSSPFASACVGHLHRQRSARSRGGRKHHSKKRRPFASGAIPVSQEIVAAGLLIAGSLLIGTAAATTSISCWFCWPTSPPLSPIPSPLKRQVHLDVIVLAGLYSLRIIAGAAATSFQHGNPSGCSASRCSFPLPRHSSSRSSRTAADNRRGQLAGRGYIAEDRYVLASSLGNCERPRLRAGSRALYVSRETVPPISISAKEWLWLVPAAMLYRVARLWLPRPARDQIHETIPSSFAGYATGKRAFVVLSVIAGLFCARDLGTGAAVMVTVPSSAACGSFFRAALCAPSWCPAFVLRLAWMLAVPIDPISDSVVYDIFAQRLAARAGLYLADGDSRPSTAGRCGAVRSTPPVLCDFRAQLCCHSALATSSWAPCWWQPSMRWRRRASARRSRASPL